MHVDVRVLNITTDASGNATAVFEAANGMLDRIAYIKDSGNPFASGVDFAITIVDTGETVWTQNDVNATATVAPRQATHSTAGVAALYAATGTAVNEKIAINGQVQVAISSGGNAKLGKFVMFLC